MFLSLSLSLCLQFLLFSFFYADVGYSTLVPRTFECFTPANAKKSDTERLSFSFFFLSPEFCVLFPIFKEKKHGKRERERERERNGKNLKNNLKIPRKCFEMFARLPFHFPLRNFVAFQSFDILWGSGDVGDDPRFWILRGFFGHWLRSFWDLTWFVEHFQDSWDFPAIGSRLSRLDWSDSLGFFRFYACVCYPPLVKQSQMKKNKKVE